MELSRDEIKNENIRKTAKKLTDMMTSEEKIYQTLNSTPPIERLGINGYDWWNEGLHGVARAGLATVFPQAIGLAATWDENLAEQVADAVSTEARAKYNMQQRRMIPDDIKDLLCGRLTSIYSAIQDGDAVMKLMVRILILHQEWVSDS